MIDRKALIRQYSLKADMLGLEQLIYRGGWCISITLTDHINLSLDHEIMTIWNLRGISRDIIVAAPIENHEEIWTLFVSLVEAIKKYNQ